MSNLSSLCLTEAQMHMHGSEFERYLQRYLFPALALFGIVGNALNLTVLLNHRMRSRSNIFLAMLAIADICFLSLLLPNVMANYEPFTFNYYFRHLYFHSKVHLLSLANWSSAVAIWCVIAVCGDRLIGIRRPLYARSHSVAGGCRMSAVMLAIVVLPCALTAYQHVAHKCIVRSYCHDSQLYSKCFAVTQDAWLPNQSNPYSLAYRQFINLSTLLNVILIILFPIVLLTALNAMLLCALRRRASDFMALNRNGTENCSQKNSGATKSSLDHQLKHQRTEQRVTLTVALIVTMFTLTNGPSAIVHLLQLLYAKEISNSDVGTQRAWYNVTMVCSALVVFGKASNFILFCLCSRHFRRRLFRLTRRKLTEKIAESRRRSSTAYITSIHIPIAITPGATLTMTSRKNTSCSAKNAVPVALSVSPRPRKTPSNPNLMNLIK